MHSALLQEDDFAEQEEGGTINLLTSLTRNAWREIEHVSDKLCDEDDGFTEAIQMLDACFQYERVEMPRALDKFFYQCRGGRIKHFWLILQTFGPQRAAQGDREVQHQVAGRCPEGQD